MRLAARSFIALIALAVPAGARAAGVVSSNWAGYVVQPAAAKRLRSVSGTWVEPAVTCTRGRASYSAVWVGLGGYSQNAKGLEQIGTDSDCTSSGRPVYSAWVELLPAGPTGLSLRISPGDRVTASVTVIGRDATLGLHNLTSGARASRRVRVKAKDVSSAEWIVEAPSACSTAGGECQTLPLADFGTVAFTSATATLGPSTAAIPSGAWAATSLQLQGMSLPQSEGRTQGYAGPGALVLATPSRSSAADGSFTVAYSERKGAQPQEGPTLPGFTGGPPS